MKSNLFSPAKYILLSLFAFMLASTSRAQLATWNNGGGDSEWNTALNWDIGVPAEGTNAFIPSGQTVNYNLPMTATTLNVLTNVGTLNVNTSGFNATGLVLQNATASMVVNSGAVLNIGGHLALVTNSVVTINPGATVNVTGTFIIGAGTNSALVGANANANFASVTNAGGIINAANTSLNPLNGSINTAARLMILGGTNNLGNFNSGRQPGGASATPKYGADGLTVSNGIVTTTSIIIGNNAHGLVLMVNGVWTNTGGFQLRNGTSTRPARFWQMGGYVITTGTNALWQVPIGTGDTGFSVIGGTNVLGGVLFGTNGGPGTGIGYFTNGGNIYIGATGISSNGFGPVNASLNSGGLFGATADWTNSVAMALSGGTFTFQAADADGTPHNISANGVLRGSGTMLKTGTGLLTLNVANTYSGNTTINAGTLALGIDGTLGTGSQITVLSNATFDVSALASPFTLAAARFLVGAGVVNGNFACASGATLNPTNLATAAAGTLIFNNTLTLTGGVTCHFDLSTGGPGANNDLISVLGDLSVSGTNTIEISSGGAPGSIHPLFQYGGVFSGGMTNFALSGGNGSIIHNAGTKTISFQVATVIRSSTNVVWKAASSANSDWDAVNRTNWLNGTLQDYFVSGDTVKFNATGNSISNINLVGNVSPASVTVDSALGYNFAGSGAIVGGGTLLKTNVGTLTITTTNLYTGSTTLAGGTLEVATLAVGGVGSAIGAADNTPASLVFNNAVMRYLGGTATTDHGITFTGNGTLEITNASATLTESGSFIGNGALIKTGPGVLRLSGGSTFAGGTVISNGTLELFGPGSTGTTANNYSLGTGSVTLQGGTLQLYGYGLNDNGNQTTPPAYGTVTNPIIIPSGVTAAVLGGPRYNFNSSVSGGGTLTFGVSYIRGNLNGDWSGFTGQVNVIAAPTGTSPNAGDFRINNNFGYTNAAIHLTSGVGLYRVNGVTAPVMEIGELSGDTGSFLGLGTVSQNNASGNPTWIIGARNTSATFAGIIRNDTTTTVIKTGTGTWTLAGTNTYTGSTTVNNGTLAVEGSLAGTPVTVNAGTLVGNGIIGGPVTVNASATLSPGASIGKLTINNSLTLVAGSTNLMQLDKANGTNDAIVNLGSITYGGSLVVANLGGTLANGDVFRLFQFAGATNITGVFDEIILPAPPGGISWNTNELYVSGQLILGTVAAPAPAFNTFTLNGSELVLGGTNGSASGNYYVLTSTNVATPMVNWTSIATNSFAPDGSFSFTNTVNTGAPQNYFRLQLP